MTPNKVSLKKLFKRLEFRYRNEQLIMEEEEQVETSP